MSKFQQISPEDAKEMMDEQDDIVILDVRTEAEYEDGHIEGAIVIPVNELEFVVESEIEDYEQTILVYCRSGNKSKMAAVILTELGYHNVYEFGGIMDWPYGIVK